MTPRFLTPNLSETSNLIFPSSRGRLAVLSRGKLFVHVWLNRARAAIVESQEVGEDGRVTVFTYPASRNFAQVP